MATEQIAVLRLNNEQSKVACSTDARTLVLAGAGTGKTTALTERVTWLINDGLDPYRILLLTFTNKAAAEMKARVRKSLGKDTAQKIWAGTFHSVAYRILRVEQEALQASEGLSIIDEQDSKAMFRRLLKERAGSLDNLPKPADLLSLRSYAINTMKPVASLLPEDLDEEDLDAIKGAFRAYRKKKREEGLVDFEDLMLFWYELFKQREDIREKWARRFKHVLVDEFQDTSKIQAHIVEMCCSHHGHLTVVGDDGQSIYGFRGASFGNILNFEGSEYKLEQNYRSTPQILALANESIKNNVHQRPKELWTDAEDGQVPVAFRCHDHKFASSCAAYDIAKSLKLGVKPNEIAVLYRSHYLSSGLQIELAKRGVKFVLRSGMPFFQKAHIKDVLSMLKWIENPSDSLSFFRFSRLCKGVGEKTASSLYASSLELQSASESLSYLPVPVRSKGDWSQIADSICTASRANDLKVRVKALVDGYQERWLSEEDENYREKIEDLQQLIVFVDNCESSEDALSQAALLSGETKEDPEDCVILSTIHRAKGLEWRVVFLLGLEDGAFPSRKSVTQAEIEEERRLFYVAVTRAERSLVMYYPEINWRSGRNAHMSRFLLEIKKTRPELIKWVNR